MLLHHFVKGRLYNRDLRDGQIFETVGGGHIKISRTPGSNTTNVNNAKITESEVFVYNLGTMFYIDEILYSHLLQENMAKNKLRPNYASGNGRNPVTSRMPADVEMISDVIHGKGGKNGANNNGDDAAADDDEDDVDDVDDIDDDDSDSNNNEDNDKFDDEIITPKALPVQSFTRTK